MNGFALFNLQSGTPLSIFHGNSPTFSSIESVSQIVGLYFGLNHTAKEAGESFIEKKRKSNDNIIDNSASSDTAAQRRLFKTIDEDELNAGTHHKSTVQVPHNNNNNNNNKNEIALQWLCDPSGEMIGCYYSSSSISRSEKTSDNDDKHNNGDKIAVLISFSSSSSPSSSSGSSSSFEQNSDLLNMMGSSLLAAYHNLLAAAEKEKKSSSSIKKRDFCLTWLNSMLQDENKSSFRNSVVAFLDNTKSENDMMSKFTILSVIAEDKYLLLDGIQKTFTIFDSSSSAIENDDKDSIANSHEYQHALIHRSFLLSSSSSSCNNHIQVKKKSSIDEKTSLIAQKLPQSSSASLFVSVANNLEKKVDLSLLEGASGCRNIGVALDAIALAVAGAGSKLKNDNNEEKEWSVQM